MLGTKGSRNKTETARCEEGGGRQGPARAPAWFSTLDLHQTHSSKGKRTQDPLLASAQVPPTWQPQVPELWPYFRKGPTGAGVRVAGTEHLSSACFLKVSSGYLCVGGLAPGPHRGHLSPHPLLFKKGFLGFLTVPRDLRGEWRVITWCGWLKGLSEVRKHSEPGTRSHISQVSWTVRSLRSDN